MRTLVALLAATLSIAPVNAVMVKEAGVLAKRECKEYTIFGASRS